MPKAGEFEWGGSVLPKQTPQESKWAERLEKIYEASFSKKLKYCICFDIAGYCDHSENVILLMGGLRNKHDLETACHEMLHAADKYRPHGKRFDNKVKKMLKLAKGIK